MTDPSARLSNMSRRELMIGAGSLAAAGGARGETAANAAPAIRGLVREIDAEGATGAGLSNVLVSNGRDVARTDAQGVYVLPFPQGRGADDECAIFVIAPDGFAAPVDAATMLPQAYYLHSPQGTPERFGFTYPGLAPTGPLPPSVDFGLRRRPRRTRFDVLMFADPQPESETEVAYVRDDVVNDLIGADAAFGVTAGDVACDDLSFYPRCAHLLAQIGVPWFSVGGNHDLNYESPGRRWSRETFKRAFGPAWRAFEHGDALFLMLDNVDYLGADPAQPRAKGGYVGRLGEEQLAFVANVLAETPREKLVVAVMHIPLRCYVDPDHPGRNTADRDAFLRLLEGRPSVSFSGHTHTTEHHYLTPEGAPDRFLPHHHHVLTTVSGSWWSGPLDSRGIACADSRDGSPNGYHVLSVDGAAYQTRFVPASAPADRQMRIMVEGAFHREKELYRDFRPGRLLSSPISQEVAAAATLRWSSIFSTAAPERGSPTGSATARRARWRGSRGPTLISRSFTDAMRRRSSPGSGPPSRRMSGQRGCRRDSRPARTG